MDDGEQEKALGLAADAELDEILRGGAVLVARSSLCLAAGVGVVRKVLAAPDITILSLRVTHGPSRHSQHAPLIANHRPSQRPLPIPSPCCE